MRSHHPAIGLLSGATAFVLVLLVALPARADTAADLAAARDQVSQLQSEAEAAYQSYEETNARLDEVNNHLKVLQDQLAAQTAQVEVSRAVMGRAARNTYMTSGVDPTLYLLLSDDADEFTSALKDVQRVSDSKADDLRVNRDLEAQFNDTTLQYGAQQQTAQQLRDQAKAASDKVASKLAQASAIENRLERQYAAELAAARAAEQAAAAAARAQAQAQAAQAAPQAAPQAVGGNFSASGARQQVLNFALSKVGNPYVFGADGPNAYDCSGLVSAAYATVGIKVGSYTGTQAKAVRRIPLSQAQPGDLLFFFERGAAHVALYLGDGRMVHAVNPSRGITTNRLSETWYAQHFTMAGALLP